MAESELQTGEQPPTGAESTSESEPFSARNFFMSKLDGERGESGEPEQPQEHEEGGSPETQADESEYEEESEQSTESVDPIEGEEEPENSAESAVFTVDGKEYTADSIKELEKGRLEYDRDYRRKTQYLARQQQELDALGEGYRDQEKIYMGLSESYGRQLSQVDTSQFSPEEFQQYKTTVQNARQSNAQLQQIFGQAGKKRQEAQSKLKEERAKVSVDMLKSAEPRWSKDFYGDLGEFAVKEDIMSAEEFSDESDWLRILGVAFLHDKAGVSKLIKDVDKDPPKPPRRRQRPQRRSPVSGKFETAQAEAMTSPNAKQDGSFREMKRRQLERERG